MYPQTLHRHALLLESDTAFISIKYQFSVVAGLHDYKAAGPKNIASKRLFELLSGCTAYGAFIGSGTFNSITAY